MHRRLAIAAIGAVVLLTAFGCGSSGNDVTAGDGGTRTQAADGAADGATQTVSYAGLEFQVPADWPVYDLAAAPTTCVRFDVNAVYLGHPSPDMVCPAGIIGRTETVQVEPDDGAVTSQTDGDGAAAAAQVINGLTAELTISSTERQEIVARFTTANVVVQITHSEDDAAAQQILQSFREAGS